MRKQSTSVSALILVTTLAIPSRSLAITPAITPINHSGLAQASNLLTAFSCPQTAPNETNEVFEQGVEGQVSGVDIEQVISWSDKAFGVVTMAMAETVTAPTSNTVSKAEETDAYPSVEKSAFPEAETALASSSYEKTLVPSNYLPWWRWLTLTPFFGIFFWSIINDRHDYTQPTSDDSSAS